MLSTPVSLFRRAAIKTHGSHIAHLTGKRSLLGGLFCILILGECATARNIVSSRLAVVPTDALTGREVSTLTDPQTVRYEPLEVIPAKALYIPPLTTYTEWTITRSQSPSSMRPQVSPALTVDGSQPSHSQDWQSGDETVSCTSTDVRFPTLTSPRISASAIQTNAEPELDPITIVICCNTSIPPAQGSSLSPLPPPPPLFSFDISSVLTPTSTTTIRLQITIYVTSNITFSGPPPTQIPSAGETTAGRSMSSNTDTKTNTYYGPIGSFTVSPIPNVGGRVSTMSPVWSTAVRSTSSNPDIRSTATRTITVVKTVIATASPATLRPSGLSALGPVLSTNLSSSSSSQGSQGESLQEPTPSPTPTADHGSPSTTITTSTGTIPSPSQTHTSSIPSILPECSIVFGTSTPSTCTLGPPAVTVHSSQGGGAQRARRAEAVVEAEAEAERRLVIHTAVVLAVLSDGRMAPQASTLNAVLVA